MTCTVYTVCAAIAGQGSPFSLSRLTAGMAALAKGASGSQCTLDFIEISGSSETCGAKTLTNKYCGDILTTNTADAQAMGNYDSNPICGKFS